MSGHTPGPWIMGDTDRYSRKIHTGRAGMTCLCSVDGIAIYVRRDSLCDEPADDARLIAAAPELLAALRVIATYDPTVCDAATLGNIARAALAKAGA